MHELSIAISLVDAVCAEAARLGAPRVSAVYLRLGPLSGVEEDALRFSFDVATQGTAAAGARLDVEPVALVARCSTCDEARRLPDFLRLACPVCGTPTPELLSGRECELVALEIDDDDASDR